MNGEREDADVDIYIDDTMLAIDKYTTWCLYPHAYFPKHFADDLNSRLLTENASPCVSTLRHLPRQLFFILLSIRAGSQGASLRMPLSIYARRRFIRRRPFTASRRAAAAQLSVGNIFAVHIRHIASAASYMGHAESRA